MEAQLARLHAKVHKLQEQSATAAQLVQEQLADLGGAVAELERRSNKLWVVAVVLAVASALSLLLLLARWLLG